MLKLSLPWPGTEYEPETGVVSELANRAVEV